MKIKILGKEAKEVESDEDKKKLEAVGATTGWDVVVVEKPNPGTKCVFYGGKWY